VAILYPFNILSPNRAYALFLLRQRSGAVRLIATIRFLFRSAGRAAEGGGVGGQWWWSYGSDPVSPNRGKTRGSGGQRRSQRAAD
jgi:hypothetical protein